jgi:hypothetical protein
MWWYTPVFPALGSRAGGFQVQAQLGYIARLCLKRIENKQTNNKESNHSSPLIDPSHQHLSPNLSPWFSPGMAMFYSEYSSQRKLLNTCHFSNQNPPLLNQSLLTDHNTPCDVVSVSSHASPTTTVPPPALPS